MIKAISKFNVNDVLSNPELFVESDVELTQIVDTDTDPAKLLSIYIFKKDDCYGIALKCNEDRQEYFPEEMENLDDVYYRVWKDANTSGHLEMTWTGEVARVDNADVLQMTKTMTDIMDNYGVPRTFIGPNGKEHHLDDPQLLEILDAIFKQTYVPILAKGLVENGIKKNKR